MLINHPLEGKRYHPNMELYPLPLLGIVVCAIYWPVDLFCSQTFQLILNSMHKYQPRVHIIRKRDHTASVINLKSEEMKTFTFPETNFIGVTAYQNQLVSSKVCRPSVLKLFQLFTSLINLTLNKNLFLFSFTTSTKKRLAYAAL